MDFSLTNAKLGQVSRDCRMYQSLREPFEAFIRQKSIEVTSPASVRDVTAFTQLLVQGLITLFPDLTLEELRLSHLIAYVEWLETDAGGRKLSKATIKSKAVMYMRHAFGRFHELGFIGNNPATQL